MRAAAVAVLTLLGGALWTGCEAIDDLSPFHAVSGDVGVAQTDFSQAADLSASSDGDTMDDSSPPGDYAFRDMIANLPDLAVPDLAAPDLAPCGVCKPGDQRTVPCGNCGMETDFCTQSCQWQAGACIGAGPCAAGATQAGTCDACSQQTCGKNCQWSACALKPGNTCHPGTTGDCSHPCNPATGGQYAFGPYQDCVNCKWDTQCYCTGCKTSSGQVQQYCYCN